MKKLLKYIIGFSIFIFFIICVNVKGVSALSKSEVEKLKEGDYVKITKRSKIYDEVKGRDDFSVIGVKVRAKQEDNRIAVGTRLQVRKGLSQCYSKISQSDVYYVWVNYGAGGACLVHYSNLEKVSLTEEEKKLINDFLEKEDVKKILDGKAKKLDDDKLIDSVEEAREIFIKTGNEEAREIMSKGEIELERNRGYKLDQQSDGSCKIIDKDGNEVGRTKGGDKVSNVSSTIYKLPKKDDTDSAGGSIDNVIEDADKFIDEGEVTYNDGLEDVSNIMYNILLTVGIMIAVLVGGIIGIKLMVSGIEGKVEAKKLLVPYVVGCIVIFGGFGIWKIVVTILQGI